MLEPVIAKKQGLGTDHEAVGNPGTAKVPREGLKVHRHSVHRQKLETEGALVVPLENENSIQQYGSSNIRREGILANGCPGDTEEKVSMCVINKIVKRLSPRSSEEQVTLFIKIMAKFVILNLIKDEPNTVDNDIRFETPLAEI